MAKLLFFDIDGTLCMPGCDPTPATVDAIHSARAKGHRVFLATGRNIPTIPKAVYDIGFDGYISNTGAVAQVGETVLLDKPLPRYLLDKTVDSLRYCDSAYMLQGLQGTYCDFRFHRQIEHLFPQVAVDLLRSLEHTLGLEDMSYCQGANIYKIVFFTPERERLKVLQGLLGDEYDFTFFDNLFPNTAVINGELNRRGGGKGVALELICRHFGQGVEDAIAFGDSTNDLDMLRAAGLGIAMGNAQPEAIAQADRICPPCGEDGVARTLEELGLA